MPTPFTFNVTFVDQNGDVLKDVLMSCTDVTASVPTDALTGENGINVDYDCWIGDIRSRAAATVVSFRIYRNGFDMGLSYAFAAVLDSVNNRLPARIKVYKGDKLIFKAT